MATQIRQFKASAKAKAKDGAKVPGDPIPFDLTLDDPAETVIHAVATPPSQSALALMMTMDFEDPDEMADNTQVLFNFMLGLVGKETWGKMRRAMLRGHLELTDVMEVIQWLVKEWVAFPTQPSSDSPRSASSGGRRSTGRVRSGASTPSTSPRTASTTSSTTGAESE